MVNSSPDEGSKESAERRQSDTGTGRMSHSSVRAKVAALELSTPRNKGSPGVLLRDMSTQIKAMKEKAQQARETRGTGRSKGIRGDSPMPRQGQKHTTSQMRERMIPEERDDHEYLDDSEDASRSLELLEARSRSLMDSDFTVSEADRSDLLELISKEKWKFVLRRLEQKPAEARLKNDMMLGGTEGQEPIETRALPIHKALCSKPPLNVVESLLAAYPDSVKVTDERWGRLPIHMALLNNANAQILKLLVMSFPRSVQMAEKKDGRVPLHLACLFGSPYEVSLLLTADERAIKARDRLGKTPLELTYQSTNCHRETIMARLQSKQSRTNASPQRVGPPLQQSMHMDVGSAPPESPGATSMYSRSKSPRRLRQKKEKVANEFALPDKKKRNRDTQSFSTILASSDSTSLPSSKSGDKGSSRSLFRRSRGRSFGHIPRPRSTSRERGILSLIGKPCVSQKGIDFTRLDDESRADDRTVASVPAVFPYSPETNISQLSVNHQEVPPEERGGGNNSLSKFIEQRHESHVATDVRSLPVLSSEKKRKEKHLEDFLERNDSDLIHGLGSAFHQISPRNDKTISTNKLMADLSLDDESTEFAANLSFASPLNGQTFFDDSSSSSDQRLDSLSEDLANDEGEDDIGKDGKFLASNHHRGMPRHFVAENNSEHAALESQLRHLSMKKEALVEECNHVSEIILNKREETDKARGRIQSYQQKMEGLQLKIEKEQASLEASESRMQLQLETLKDHQSKLKSLMSEIRVLKRIRENLASKN
jgi:hypothetical protein